ncbi:hypothetical protein D0C16_08230 [Cellvibrio sp. KY-GH-1]|uniref:hypothetical protein n=1 Tax=Cellvibrio sp. KY-GH-1 TaxID=2303332 RepID=UPI0012493C2B|nr:hypothetical protein [Cellvibrio sp. KY-GH-1]QEY15961.1 hypothetical protein D0C16_08230 [Cellvibrio sp. KY-GH-1]
MNKSSLAKRGFKHVMWLFLSFVLLIIIVKIGLGLIGTEAEQIEMLNRWRDSGWLIWIRYAIYAVLWFGWGPLLRQFNKELSDAMIKASRRPLIALIVLYEIFIARDLPRLISSWIS